MKTILVPTDFSKPANNASLFAIRFAKEIGAKVLLYHAYDFPIGLARDLAVPIATPDELKNASENLLKKMVKRFQKNSSVEVNYKTKMGAAVDSILEEEHKASYIVMGIQGVGKLQESFLGSTTTVILQKTTKPLLIIPEKAKYAPLKRIVLAADYNPSIKINSFDTLKMLIKKFHSDIFIVNIRHKKELVTKENTVAESKLENVLKGGRHFYYYPETEDVVDGINEFVKSKQANMIAIVPHKYKFFNKLFHKSSSKQMAFHTKVPLLALPNKNK